MVDSLPLHALWVVDTYASCAVGWWVPLLYTCLGGGGFALRRWIALLYIRILEVDGFALPAVLGGV